MAKSASGTFSDTGNSAEVTVQGKALITMNFAGTATVNVQIKDSAGSFFTLESWTESDAKVFDAAGAVIRLNCSAHTDNVVYAVG